MSDLVIHTYTAAEPGLLADSHLPDAPLEWLIGLGADAVAAELSTLATTSGEAGR